jgi:two-component sensor histidine kinase/DNA-binding response OmpR family regulator
MRAYVRRILEPHYEVITVADGEAALSAIREKQPALVLSDVMMPRLDGFGLVQQLRADPSTNSLPIVLLSARAGEESRVEGLEHGADDYLVKPFTARELVARVNTHLELGRMRVMMAESLRRSNEELEQLVEQRTLRLDEANRALQISQTRLESELESTRQLQQVSTQLIEAGDMQAIYEQIMDAAQLTVHSDFASIQMFYPERETSGALRLLGSRGFTPRARAFWEWVDAQSQTTCGVALGTGKRSVIVDVNQSEFLAGTEHLDVFRETGIVGLQTTPLLARSGGLLGAFSTHWRTPHVLTESEERTLDVLGRLAADVIDRSRAETKLRESLGEKEALLKEVHHRVRNNLQVITSLFNLQATRTKDPEALVMFNAARNRVEAIASIHEMLYRSDSLASVDIAAYTRRLVPALVRFYGLEEKITIEVLAEVVSLDLDRAVSYGLLLNELISNTCKHAFPNDRNGKLTTSLIAHNRHIELRVVDTGVGFPETFVEEKRGASLGGQLMSALARRLGGGVKFNSGSGAVAVVEFPMLAPAEDLE